MNEDLKRQLEDLFLRRGQLENEMKLLAERIKEVEIMLMHEGTAREDEWNPERE